MAITKCGALQIEQLFNVTGGLIPRPKQVTVPESIEGNSKVTSVAPLPQ